MSTTARRGLSMRDRLRRVASLRGALIVAVLTAVWCSLWNDWSTANLLSGVALAIAIRLSGVGPPGRGGIRVVPLLRFVGLVAVDLVRSTANVAWEVLTPTDRTDEAIIEVRPMIDARSHFLMLVIAITVTPGTAVVDTDPDTGALYLHILHSEHADEVRRHVEQLAELACAALPLDDDDLRRAVDRLDRSAAGGSS